MELVFLENVLEIATPDGGEAGPFKRGDTHKLSNDVAGPLLKNHQALELINEPNGGPWELIKERDRVVLLSIDDENGEMGLSEPFVFKCFRCHEVIPKPSPEEPVVCPNPNCSAQKTFKFVSPERINTMWKDGEIKPDWKMPELPERVSIDELYSEVIDCIRKHLVLKREDEYHILASWIIASWRKEDFHTCPYILFRGEINSGKTRGLELLAELVYRGAPTIGTSPAYLYRISEWFDTTILVDEASGRLNRKYESGQWMYDFVTSGYRRGLFIGRCKRNDPDKTDRFDPFTFIALASRESFDAAVNSRCIIMDMENNVPEIEDLDEKWCRKLRSKLLWVKLNESFELPETTLHTRTREKFLPLMAVADRIGERERMEEFAKNYERRMKLSDVDTLKEGIAQVLYDSINREERMNISQLRSHFEDRGLEISSQYLGKLTNDMGFDEFKHRSMDGTYISLADATGKIEYWADYYHLGYDEDEDK